MITETRHILGQVVILRNIDQKFFETDKKDYFVDGTLSFRASMQNTDNNVSVQKVNNVLFLSPGHYQIIFLTKSFCDADSVRTFKSVLEAIII